MNSTKFKEGLGKAVFTAAAIICIIAVVSIFAFLIIRSIPAFSKIGVIDFIFGDRWSPDRLDKYEDAQLSGTYGIFTMIVGTFAATVGALLIGGTIGLFLPGKAEKTVQFSYKSAGGNTVCRIRIFRNSFPSSDACEFRPE